MNKIYKVIWSKVRNCYVAVSEIAKRNGKNCTSVNCGAKASRGHAGVALSAAVGATLLAGVCSVLLPVRIALAAPVMPTLDYRGATADVTIASTSSDTSATMNISSTKTNNVMKWIDFSIGNGGTVQYDANNYLNYVTGHGRSEIDGALKGTGSIYLINPNGILFGSTAQVDVGNLYLSTRELDQSKLDAFAENGTNPLATAATSAAGDIVNLGTLNATNITVEGNNVSFKNVEEVTPATAVNVRASGEVHVGYAASEAVNEVNATQYTDGNITAPDLSKWSFTGLDSSAAVEPTQYMLVRNAFELQNMQNRKTKVSDRNYRIEGNYMLANDIDFNDVSFNFKPIGYSDNGSSETVHRFGGKFDGLNFRIRNLTITDATLEAVSTDEDPVDHNIGLFGVNSGLIENVGVENTNIDVTTYTVGGVVGWNTNGTIRNVYHTGNVKGTRAVGGIAGANQNYSLIETAYNTGNVVASDSNAGGIAGFNPGPSSNINNVYNTGSISSAGNSGGIVGQCSTGTTIENAYNTGTVAGRGTGVGGILGMSASTYNQGVAVHIKQTYNTGTVTNKNDDSSGGGIFGRSVLPSGSNVNIVSSYFSNGNDNGYGTLKTNADLHKIDTFEGWDISAEGGSGKTWRLYQGQNTSSTAYPYPLLTAFLKPKDLIKVYEYDGQPHTIDSYNDEIFNDINIKKGPVNSWIKIHVTNAGVLDYSSSANGQYDKRLFYSTQDGYDIADMKLIVQPKKLTATFADISKVYDRDTTATADTKSLSGKISGDTVDFADGITGVFADKNVGTNKDVTYSNIALTGASADNYIIADTATGAGAITPKALTVSFANTDKTYDGNTTATPGDGTLSTAVIISGDTVTLDTSNISALYTDKNVGDNKTVNYSGIALGGADAGNYSIAETAEGKGTITAKELTVSFANTDKTYDGSTTATPGEGTLSTAGIISGDTVTLDTANMYALYADKNVGENKTVNYSGIALGGTDAGNYSIAETAEGKGTITAKALTVSFADISKTYDGNTNATPGTGTLSTDDIISGDTVTLDTANIAAAYASPTAGTGNKTVNYSGIALGGTDAGNYSIATTAQNTTSTISAKTLTVGNISKVYDSTAEAILTLNNLIGVVDGDAADLSISGVTANYTGDNAVDAGTGKTVDYSGLTLGGTKSVNYSIAANGTSTTGNEITARPLTMGSVSKVYDGTDHALVTVYALTNAIEDDLLDLGISATSATYSDKNVGDNLDVNYTGLSLSGAKAGNYTIDSDAAVTGNSITPKELTLVADKVTIKNGEAVPTSFTGNVIGFVGEEGLASQDDLKFELATPGATMAGSYAVIGMLKDSESGDYQANGVYSTDNTFKNYTFSNSPTNGKAFTIAVDVMPQLDYRGASADVTIDSATTANTMAISSIQLNNVLKWIDFSIGSGGTVQFDENNYLNYVTGHGRSEINGTLKGGGAIYLINPNGMLFGSDAQVNVGNLYLSSRSLAQSELDAFTVSGTNPFGTTVNAAVGDIANLGTLKAANITVEGNNVSFKNYADITATNNINVRASGEVHVGFANDATAATAINSTEYTTVNEPDLTNWNFKGLDNSTNVTPVKYMLVRNPYELQNINNNLTGNYMLANDIDFIDENGNWTIRYFKSLGSKGNYWGSQPGMFQGRLDGLNHVIRNINITNTNNESYSTDVGIIGSNAGTVENFGVVNGTVDLSSKSWVGGIVGANKGCGIIRNVYFSGLVEGNRNVGGIAGAQDGKNTQEGVPLPGGIIEKAYVLGTVRSNNNNGSNVGGIAGSNASGARISEAYNSANVGTKTGGNYTGGIAGTNSGSIINVYNTGTIEGGSYVGGIAGSNSSSGSIQNTYNTGTVSGRSNLGGIVGYNSGTGPIASFFTQGNNNGKGTLISDESKLKEFATFEGTSLASNMSKTGGSGTVWRIYEGQTGPLLTAFLKTKDVVTATEYDGTEQTFDNTLAQGAANHIYATESGDLVKGTDAGKYFGNNTDNNNPGYKVYYSEQGGYDIGDTILVIQPKRLSIADVSKVYDGNQNVTSGISINGDDIFGNDAVGLDGEKVTGVYEDKNAGTGKTVTYTVNAGALTGEDANNYSIASIVTGSGTITAKELSLAHVSKTYDGTTEVEAGDIALATDIIEGDAVIFDSSKVTGAYEDKNVNVSGSKSVTYTTDTGVLTGTDAGNYSIAAVGTGDITKADITLMAENVTKTYDGTTKVASADRKWKVSAGELFGDDSVSGGTFAFTDKNAGTNKTVTVSGATISDGNEGGNYNVTYADNTTSTISKADLTLTAEDVAKTYDGTMEVASADRKWKVSAGELFGDDSVSGGTFAFTDKNAGTNKTVAVSGATISDGNEGGNYNVTYADNTTSTISKADLTLTAEDVTKTYDGTTEVASADRKWKVSAGELFGDDSVSGGTFAFTDKNAGTNKTVTVSGATVSDGNEGGNYNVTYADNTTSTINPKPITASFADISKIYDGTTAATAGEGTLDGVVEGDTGKVSVTANAAYDEKNVGNRTVNYTGVTLSGEEASNYSIAETATGAGTITAKEITATFADISKVYDGTTSATAGEGTLDGVVDGDKGKVEVTATAAYDSKDAGNRTINYTGVKLSGVEAANYTIAGTLTGKGTIKRKALELVADPVSTEYGDYIPASFTGRVDGFVTGESISNGDSLLFALSDPSASAVGSYGITGTINGSSSGEYGLNYTFNNAASNENAFVIYARPASVQDMVLSDIIPGIKGKPGADISVTALDDAMEQARDKRAKVGIEFAVAQTILSVDADKTLSLENQGMKQPPSMTAQEVAEQVHAQQTDNATGTEESKRKKGAA